MIAISTNQNTHPTAAPDPVECPSSPTGKHAPRTVENIETINGVETHTKTSVCHHCNQVA